MKRTPLPRPTKPLRRKTPLPRSKYHRQVRVGHLGIVRLRGKALKTLRRQCFDRDKFTCVDCGRTVAWDWKDALDFDLPVGEMSHVRKKRMYGDALENVVTRCRRCHQNSHNCGGKPLAKEQQ